MRTTPTPRKQQTHELILDTAAAVLREQGFAGVGVADIMKRAGLTHGGFYAHFDSRDAMLAEALERAGEDGGIRLQRSAARRAGASAFGALVESYLSDAHLAGAAGGCPVAALVAELPRQSDEVRACGMARIESLVATVKEALPAAHAGNASVIASQMVGALQIARAYGDGARGKRHLAATRQFLLEQFDTPRR
jgi:TetR/AcrR family transcriptional repressor of nem operon